MAAIYALQVQLKFFIMSVWICNFGLISCNFYTEKKVYKTVFVYQSFLEGTVNDY